MMATQQPIEHPISSKTIARESSACLDGFRRSISALGKLHHAQAAAPRNCLDDELDRFMLWTSNIGVFADVNQSLDFRLQEIPDVVELFLKQLEIISCRLDQRNGDTTPLGREPRAEKAC